MNGPGRSEEQIAADFSLGDTLAARAPYAVPLASLGEDGWEHDDDMASATSSNGGGDGEAPSDEKVAAGRTSTDSAKTPFRARTASSVCRKAIDKTASGKERTLKATKSQ